MAHSLDQKYRALALREYERMHAPLKFRTNGDRYEVRYRGWTYVDFKPFTKTEIENIKRLVDRETEETIASFVNPIFREVFGK